MALNEPDFAPPFGELTSPDFRVRNRSRSLLPDRSAAELRASIGELNAMVASMRFWQSAVRWVSPTVCVSRNEREAVGRDGEQYAWVHLYVIETCERQVIALCEFDVDDEEAAFAFAEERARSATSRLTVANRASQTWDAIARAAQAHDVDAVVGCYAESLTYDDRRRLAGNPLDDLRTAVQRIQQQYTSFEGRTLAVRGKHLHLGSSRWSDDSGFETAYLFVHEVGEDGRIVYEGRFVRRSSCEHNRTLHCPQRGRLRPIVQRARRPRMRVENRTRSGFPDRSTAEVRASHEELNAMVASTRSWHSAERWLSPNVCVCRHERHAEGLEGGRYSWTRLQIRNRTSRWTAHSHVRVRTRR